jgi:hypothetical protein
MAIDPTLIVLILLVGNAVVFLVLASRRRTGRLNLESRISGVKPAVFVVEGAARVVLVASSLPTRGQDRCRAHKQQQGRHP